MSGDLAVSLSWSVSCSSDISFSATRGGLVFVLVVGSFSMMRSMLKANELRVCLGGLVGCGSTEGDEEAGDGVSRDVTTSAMAMV